MAVAKPKTLVLCGVSVVRDVVAGTLGNGFKPASCRTAATPISISITPPLSSLPLHPLPSTLHPLPAPCPSFIRCYTPPSFDFRRIYAF